MIVLDIISDRSSCAHIPINLSPKRRSQNCKRRFPKELIWWGGTSRRPKRENRCIRGWTRTEVGSGCGPRDVSSSLLDKMAFVHNNTRRGFSRCQMKEVKFFMVSTSQCRIRSLGWSTTGIFEIMKHTPSRIFDKIRRVRTVINRSRIQLSMNQKYCNGCAHWKIWQVVDSRRNAIVVEHKRGNMERTVLMGEILRSIRLVSIRMPWFTKYYHREGAD